MEIFILKLILTPTLICAASLAGRRWGAAVGGWLGGFPLTSAPIALFLAFEQGAEFAARAAQGILFGLLSVGVFCLVYTRLAFRLKWLAALLTGWTVFFTTTFVLQQIEFPPIQTFTCVFVVLAIIFKLMPAKEEAAVDAKPPPWDIPARMIIATSFVLLLTGLAGMLGARLSGLLAPFPIFASILAVFTHRFQSTTAASQLLRGVVLGSFSFAVFFLILSLTIERAGIATAFIYSTLAALALQGLSLLFISRK